MVRLSLELRKRVIMLHSKGSTVQEIHQRLQEVDISVGLCAIYNLLRKYCEKSILIDIPRRSRRRKITPEMRVVIEEMYNENGELTSTRIKSLLTKRGQICRCQMYVKRNGLAVHKTSLFQLLFPVSVSCCNYLL